MVESSVPVTQDYFLERPYADVLTSRIREGFILESVVPNRITGLVRVLL